MREILHHGMGLTWLAKCILGNFDFILNGFGFGRRILELQNVGAPEVGRVVLIPNILGIQNLAGKLWELQKLASRFWSCRIAELQDSAGKFRTPKPVLGPQIVELRGLGDPKFGRHLLVFQNSEADKCGRQILELQDFGAPEVGRRMVELPNVGAPHFGQ